MRFLTVILVVAAGCMWAQEPATEGARRTASSGKEAINAAAIAGSKQDPAAVAAGSKVFATYCAGCHGAAANGGPGAPDLVRSLLVLDDEKGILIAPVIREGRPDKGMPKLNLTEPQIAQVVAWLHARTFAAGHRSTYTYGNVVTGDAKAGAVYFNGDGKCSTCHSVTGDLAGIGRKYDAFSLQGRWLQPRNARAGSKSGGPPPPKVTVTPASGQPVTGTLDQIDDFTVSLHDAAGDYHSFARDGVTAPKVEIQDPLKGHTDLLGQYTDADIHNVTAYLVTLK